MTKRAKLENDSAYQLRRAVEAGGRVPTAHSTSAPGVTAPALATSQIQLTAPTKPTKSSAGFLAEWDGWIRAANFGELLLSICVLIFIRTRSAKTNTPGPTMDFSSLLSAEKKSRRHKSRA
jgi:hypothetical protein